LLLVAGTLGCLLALSMVLLGIPASWLRLQEVYRLPRPDASELATMTPGSRVLVRVQLSPELRAGPHGLSLFYRERSTGRGSSTSATGWERDQPPPSEVAVLLDAEQTLMLQIPQNTSFEEAMHVTWDEVSLHDPSDRPRSFPPEAPRAPIGDHPPGAGPPGSPGDAIERRPPDLLAPDGADVRYVGYVPQQSLTVEGIWQGQAILTAQVLYGGTSEAYIASLERQPGMLFFSGMMCCGFSLTILGAGLTVRLLGRRQDHEQNVERYA
ncbi:MAG: hypothetical protein HC837_08630, partial [Chloroflexaceae bacterium]|nr:hypothetical protein [Chloroflexaceae bacterium]